MSQNKFLHKLDLSALLTVIGVIILFSSAIVITLVAPNYMDPSWVQPSSRYQKLMYEQADPNTYISSESKGSRELQFVYHIRKGETLLGFQESETVRIIAPAEYENVVTRFGEQTLKLTRQLFLLREPEGESLKRAEELKKKMRADWEKTAADAPGDRRFAPSFIVLELFTPEGEEAFSVAPSNGILENWVDERFEILGEGRSSGEIYVYNPVEYRISRVRFGDEEEWRYDPKGKPVSSLGELKGLELGFRSRKELIAYGEQLFAWEGCWYCHTDQTRTLVQDVVLNGSESYPAPPSSANEYIYQRITFPGTRRIGPDLSRVGVKRPNRDWHKSHFWSPKTESKGSIMPSFQHFFDADPRGTSRTRVGIPNYKFEAVFQYLMTKGTRITPPTEAWWLGRDPVQTKEIIEGRRKIP